MTNMIIYNYTERTFLAWLRTSLAFASIGIAVGQLFRLNTTFDHQSSPHSSHPSHPRHPHPRHPPSHPNDQFLFSPPSFPPPPHITPRDPTTEQSNRAHKMARLGKPLGVTFLAISIVVLFIGFHRFFESQAWLMRGKFPASRFSIFVVTVIAGALIVGSLVLILVVDPTVSNSLK